MKYYEYYINELSLLTRTNLAYFLNTPLGVLFVQAQGLNKRRGGRRDTALIRTTIDKSIISVFMGKFFSLEELWIPPKVESVVTWEAGQSFDLPLEPNCPSGYNVMGAPIIHERVQKICARSFNNPLLIDSLKPKDNFTTMFWWWRYQRTPEGYREVVELCECERKCPFALQREIKYLMNKLPAGYVPVRELEEEEEDKDE